MHVVSVDESEEDPVDMDDEHVTGVVVLIVELLVELLVLPVVLVLLLVLLVVLVLLLVLLLVDVLVEDVDGVVVQKVGVVVDPEVDVEVV